MHRPKLKTKLIRVDDCVFHELSERFKDKTLSDAIRTLLGMAPAPPRKGGGWPRGKVRRYIKVSA